MPSRILVHGHRGARAVFPENTLPGFEHAIRAGADYIELDLAVTKDDVVVVSHDPVLNSRICTAPPGAWPVIREIALSELRTWDCGARRHPFFRRQLPVPGACIPALDEVLEAGKLSGIRFNLEVKSDPLRPRYSPPPERFAELVLLALRRRGMESRALVQSFDFRVLRAMQQLDPSIALAALFARGRDFAAIARQAGAGTAAPYYRLVRRRRVEAAHRAGVQVVPWTVNGRRRWRAMVRAGVDGIITDDPAGLVEFLKNRAPA